MKDLLPYITNSIWLGKMNQIRRRVTKDIPEEEIRKIEEGQSDSRILQIYDRLKDEPMVRWKSSIKPIVGIRLPERRGMDI